MKVRKGKYVILDSGIKAYVLKGTNKEDGFIKLWDLVNKWEFGTYVNHVIKVL